MHASEWQRIALIKGEYKLCKSLGTVKQQGIMGVNVDPDLCRHIAFRGHEEFNT